MLGALAWWMLHATSSSANSSPILQSTPMRGLYVLGLISAAVHFLGDLRVLEEKTRAEVLYHRTAQWLPG